MGIEQWGFVAQELKIDYPELEGWHDAYRLAILVNSGMNKIRGTLMTLSSVVDFCEPVIKAPYSGPNSCANISSLC